MRNDYFCIRAVHGAMRKSLEPIAFTPEDLSGAPEIFEKPLLWHLRPPRGHLEAVEDPKWLLLMIPRSAVTRDSIQIGKIKDAIQIGKNFRSAERQLLVILEFSLRYQLQETSVEPTGSC